MAESKSTSIGSRLKEVGSHSLICVLGSIAQSILQDPLQVGSGAQTITLMNRLNNRLWKRLEY